MGDRYTCVTCGLPALSHDYPIKTGACLAFCPQRPVCFAEPPASSFPPELVERAIREPEECPEEFLDAENIEVWMRGRQNGVRSALSVVAEWLRSDEVRERACIEAQEAADAYTEMDLTGWRKVSDAVLAAALEGKER